jgi:hypothetical protein
VTTDAPLGTDAAAVARSLDEVAAALQSHNVEAVVVEDGNAAREFVLGLIPDGAEVYSGKSKTLEDIGLYSELVDSGRYDAVRGRMAAMDRATQSREMRKLWSGREDSSRRSPRRCGIRPRSR